MPRGSDPFGRSLLRGWGPLILVKSGRMVQRILPLVVVKRRPAPTKKIVHSMR
jgi:hypothetical protein